MARIRANNASGGGGGIDITNPDVYDYGAIAGSGSKSVTVTQKPRYIVFCQTAGATGMRLYLIDCEKESILEKYYWGSSYSGGTPSFSSIVTAISSSAVTLKSGTSVATNNFISIYY